MKFAAAFVLAFAIMRGPAFAQSATDDAWIAGYCAAVKQMQNNRAHYRSMLGYPIDGVPDGWPPYPVAGVSTETEVDKMKATMMAGIDLYVMVPGRERCAGR